MKKICLIFILSMMLVLTNSMLVLANIESQQSWFKIEPINNDDIDTDYDIYYDTIIEYQDADYEINILSLFNHNYLDDPEDTPNISGYAYQVNTKEAFTMIFVGNNQTIIEVEYAEAGMKRIYQTVYDYLFLNVIDSGDTVSVYINEVSVDHYINSFTYWHNEVPINIEAYQPLVLETYALSTDIFIVMILLMICLSILLLYRFLYTRKLNQSFKAYKKFSWIEVNHVFKMIFLIFVLLSTSLIIYERQTFKQSLYRDVSILNVTQSVFTRISYEDTGLDLDFSLFELTEVIIRENEGELLVVSGPNTSHVLDIDYDDIQTDVLAILNEFSTQGITLCEGSWCTVFGPIPAIRLELTYQAYTIYLSIDNGYRAVSGGARIYLEILTDSNSYLVDFNPYDSRMQTKAIYDYIRNVFIETNPS